MARPRPLENPSRTRAREVAGAPDEHAVGVGVAALGSDIVGGVTPSLQTARLLLRPLAQADVRVLAQIEAGSTIAWSLFPIGSDAAVGVVGLHHIDRAAACAQVAYELDEAYSGRGLATEALQRVLEFASAEIGLWRIEAHIDPNNSRSLRLVERLGFVRECEREDYIVYATTLLARDSTRT
ncbi:MAG: GNAT family N-acetyltransferase [Chloroflexi bacterium]|nr:MAG: GNAT family N-acetyltransferase [Chloroflexota bacterium]